jgi:hypothetical protein
MQPISKFLGQSMTRQDSKRHTKESEQVEDSPVNQSNMAYLQIEIRHQSPKSCSAILRRGSVIWRALVARRRRKQSSSQIIEGLWNLGEEARILQIEYTCLTDIAVNIKQDYLKSSSGE